MQFEGRVGPAIAADGTLQPPRLSTFLASVIQNLSGKYLESVIRGNVYVGGTAVTGVAPGTSIGTTSPFTLFNPKGSGKALVVLRTTAGYISGTLGAGVVHYVASVDPGAAAVTGTAIVPVNCLLSAATGIGKPFTTATLPATPSVMRPFFSMSAFLASTAVEPFTLAVDDVDGEFVIPPGCALSLEGTAAAGSSPLVTYGMTWEEVPFS